jgi:hypothetical protein
MFEIFVIANMAGSGVLTVIQSLAPTRQYGQFVRAMCLQAAFQPGGKASELRE